MLLRVQRIALLALVGNGLAGMARSSGLRLAGRPFGLGWPWARRSELILWGTAISPPLVLGAVMVAVAVLPASRAHTVHRIAPLLGACVGAGQFAEPVVYRLRHEARGVRAAVGINIGLALLLVLTGARSRSGG